MLGVKKTEVGIFLVLVQKSSFLDASFLGGNEMTMTVGVTLLRRFITAAATDSSSSLSSDDGLMSWCQRRKSLENQSLKVLDFTEKGSLALWVNLSLTWAYKSHEWAHVLTFPRRSISKKKKKKKTVNWNSRIGKGLNIWVEEMLISDLNQPKYTV